MIEKYYKKLKAENILEIKFINYLKTNLYIRLDYFKKDKLYKLSWVNLDRDEKNILKYISTEVMEEEAVFHIINIFENNAYVAKKINHKINTDKVEIKTNIKTIIPGNNHFEFVRYLPEEWFFMIEPLIIISKTLPTKLDNYFVMALASMTGEQYKYDYLNSIKLNILKDDVDKLFQPRIIEIGKLLKNNIRYIEKIDNTFYSYVEDIINHAVIIKEESKNRVVLNCSCPKDYYCEHIYATLISIKEEINKPFYKVIFNDPNIDLLDKVTNSKIVLATKVVEDKIELINELGEIGQLPILNENKECNWKIIEDDEENNLEKQLENILLKGKDDDNQDININITY